MAGASILANATRGGLTAGLPEASFLAPPPPGLALALLAGAALLAALCSPALRASVAAAWAAHSEIVRKGLEVRKKQFSKWDNRASADADEEAEAEDKAAEAEALRAGAPPSTWPPWATRRLRALRRWARKVGETVRSPVWIELLIEARHLNLGFLGAGLALTLVSSTVSIANISLQAKLIEIVQRYAEKALTAAGVAAAAAAAAKDPAAAAAAAAAAAEATAARLGEAWGECVFIFQTMLVYSLSLTLLSSMQGYCFWRSSSERSDTLRRRYYRNLLIQDKAFYKKEDKQKLMGFIDADMSDLDSMLLQLPRSLLSAASNLLLSTAVLMRTDARILCVLALLQLPELLGLQAWMRRIREGYRWYSYEVGAGKYTSVSTAMKNIDTVQLAASEEYEVQLVKAASKLMMQAQLQEKLPSLVNSLLQKLLYNVNRIIETGLLIRAILAGSITLGDYFVWSSYSSMWSTALSELSDCVKTLDKSTPGIVRWMSLRSRVPGILEKEEPLPETATLAEREAATERAKALKVAQLKESSMHYIGRSDTTSLRDDPALLPMLPEAADVLAAAAAAGGRRRGGPGSRRGSFSSATAAASSAEQTSPTSVVVPPVNSLAIVSVGAEQFRARIRGAVEFRDVFFSYPEGEVESSEDGGKGGGSKGGGGKGGGGKGGKGAKPAAQADAGAGAGASAAAPPEQPAGPAMILKGLSFKIEAGSQVAIVGRSGCGKTTIFRLIARLYDATRGEVLIDGRPIRSYNVRSLRRCLGYMEQGAVIFEGRT